MRAKIARFQSEAARHKLQDTIVIEPGIKVWRPLRQKIVCIEKKNGALEDRFGELSRQLDALESKQRDRHVTLGTDHRDGKIPDLFGDLDEECFSALPTPLSLSPYRQLPQQQEKPRVRPTPGNGSTSWEDY